MELVDTRIKIPRRSRCAGSSPARGTIYLIVILFGNTQKSCSLLNTIEGALAEWLCSWLQIRGPVFDSGGALHNLENQS